MNENFYALFFKLIIASLAVYGGLNLSTQVRLGETLRPTMPSILADEDVGAYDTAKKGR